MNKRINIYLFLIAAYGFIGLFNSFIANSKPILLKSKNGFSSPAGNDFLVDIGLKEKYNYTVDSSAVWSFNALIPFGAKDIFMGNALGEQKHLLGIDNLGRDTAAGIVRGCYTSFRIGVFSTLLCAIIGIFLGIAMAYYSDRLYWNIAQIFTFLLSFFFFLFYLIYPVASSYLQIITITLLLAMMVFLPYSLRNLKVKKFKVPFNESFMSIIELRRSVPTLILLLVLFPLFSKPSVNNVVLVIVVLSWTNFARHARAEALSVKNRDFVIASQMMGASFFHLAWKHILPNIATTLLVIATFNFSSNILLESTLSFLGMGLPPDEVSWGSMMSEGRKNFDEWRLVVYPGLALFILVFSINKLRTKLT